MKFDLPFFDRIRVKPDQDRRLRADDTTCEWPSCACAATYRAPKGRLREGQYWRSASITCASTMPRITISPE